MARRPGRRGRRTARRRDSRIRRVPGVPDTTPDADESDAQAAARMTEEGGRIRGASPRISPTTTTTRPTPSRTARGT